MVAQSASGIRDDVVWPPRLLLPQRPPAVRKAVHIDPGDYPRSAPLSEDWPGRMVKSMDVVYDVVV